MEDEGEEKNTVTEKKRDEINQEEEGELGELQQEEVNKQEGELEEPGQREIDKQEGELEDLSQVEVDKQEGELGELSQEELDKQEGELEELSQEEVDKQEGEFGVPNQEDKHNGELEELRNVKEEDEVTSTVLELTRTILASEDEITATADEDAGQNISAEEDAGENKPSLEDEVIHKETMDMLEDSDKQAKDNAGLEKEDSGEEDDEGRKLKKPKPADGMSPDTRGDEDEIMSEQIFGDEEEEKIPDDFYYEFEEHVSKPAISDESGLPSDVLTLTHSFGYDCLKRANLHVLAKDVVAFAAGNFVQVVNLKTKHHEYLRSTCGGGIGALMVHPTKKYLAVAEKGVMPNINIYEYPSLRLYRILRGGTQNAYTYVDFSPDGKLLASVGSDPDYMLTLWDWKQEKIVLRSKAFSQDIFRVTFSVELEGQLTSSGIGHIRFWKMARTFTGLKLQGQLGKFGKKEISDIEGYVELPDGKVLSGSEWGNMLLWDGGLIKVEISRKNKKPCHQGSIQQIIMDEGELMTIGNDGYIRVWDFETVDNADTTNEMELFEMEPMNELRVGNDVQLRCMVKSCDPDETTFWYAQDASGGIWKLDLSFSFTSAVPEKLYSFHAGAILQCASSPVSHLVATVGVDNSVRIYDYLTKTPLCMARFNLAGTALLWPSKTVDSKGSTLLAGFDDGVLRILSLQKVEGTDQHGRKQMDKSELVLKQALKPHKSRITSVDIDSKGELLATGSNDCTIFFMNIRDDFEPIGFVVTPSPVTHIQWSPASFKRNTLLVCCLDGQVLEIEAPESGKFDTSHTFQIEGLIKRTHQFKSVKSIIRHEEELARLAREEEERKKKEEEEQQIRLERGIEPESTANTEQMEKEEKKEEPWEPYTPEKPSPILCGFYSKEEGKFWLSMGGYDSGYLYECEFLDEEQKKKKSKDMLYEPSQIIPVRDSNDVAISSIQFSTSSRHLFFGMENGMIRIQPLQNEDPGLMGPYWSLTVHDNHYGKISNLCSSFDDRFLFSVGMDGNFFMFEMMSDLKLEQAATAAARAKIPSAKKELTEIRADDIADPKAYRMSLQNKMNNCQRLLSTSRYLCVQYFESIEDAKQKSEYDKMLQMAEAKKTSVRQMVNTLRDKFKTLMDKNCSLPEHIQVNIKEFVMDPEIKKELQHQTLLKITAVKKEMAWEEAKHQLALDKMRNKFKDMVECEFIVVKAFQSSHEVTSFRCPILSKGFYAVKEDIENRRTAQLMKELTRQETSFADEKLEEMQLSSGELEMGDIKLVTSVRGSMGERIIKSLAKVEEKKRKRLVRQNQWQELLNSRPDVNSEDPVEVAAIKEAEENMGDYKLKSSSDYVVPDHLRMNTEKARIKLVILKELIHHYKETFNQRLLALRDKKIAIISDISSRVEELQAVQSQLRPHLVQPNPEIPHLDPSEIPEKKYEYTRETLLKYKEDLEQKEKASTTTPDPLLGGVMGVPQPITSTPQSTKVPSTLDQDQLNRSESDAVRLTQLEMKIKESEEIRLIYRRDELLKEIDTILKNFDSQLRCLRHEKYQLDIEIKMADLRHMTLYEEFMLLKDFEKRENGLASKVEEKHEEKADMQNKIAEAVTKLELKKKDIEKLMDKEKAQTAAFLETLADNKFSEFLIKVYKKKIKRSKAKTNEGQGGDEDSDEDSDDGSDFSESEEESESEAGGLDLDACPPGCDQTIYDSTCMLREKRLDVEEALAEEKKNRDAMVKDLENMHKKAKVIEAASKAAEQELEAFQLEKQHKLNELDVIITLNLHQIEYIVNGILPNDLSPCLVFESPGVTRLQHRIEELIQERSTQKVQQKDARKQHVQLIKDRRMFDHRISVMKEECEKLMMQKFGCVVDIEKLETVTFNRQIEEVKERLSMVETECSNELLQWDDDIMAAKDDMTSLIRQNTAVLNQLTMLYGEKKHYEKDLDARQKNLGTEFSGIHKSAIEERQRLIQLVHYQAQEIEAMKDEIMMLSRKGGHILPPAQPSMPRSAPTARPLPNL